MEVLLAGFFATLAVLAFGVVIVSLAAPVFWVWMLIDALLREDALLPGRRAEQPPDLGPAHRVRAVQLHPVLLHGLRARTPRRTRRAGHRGAGGGVRPHRSAA